MKGRGVPLGYVAGLTDVRTPVAVFFSILLGFNLNRQ